MTYSDTIAEFKKYIDEARTKTTASKKIGLAIGAYKLNNHPEVFAGEVNLCEAAGGYACVVLGYGDLLKNAGLRNILTSRGASRDL